MKEHDCYWAWFKGRDNQDELATWHKIFQRNPSPRLEFCKESQVWMDVIQCCMMIGWTYLESSSHSFFAIKPGMVSDQNTQRNIFIIIFLFLFHKGITVEGENSYYLLKVLALGQKLILGKPSNCTQVGEVSPPTSTFVYLSQDSHNEICNIYDKHMHLQPPFQSLYEQGVWGDWRSCVWQC